MGNQCLQDLDALLEFLPLVLHAHIQHQSAIVSNNEISFWLCQMNQFEIWVGQFKARVSKQ